MLQTSTHICCAARDTAGKLCGIVMAAVQPAAAEQMLQELLSGFSDQDIKKHKFELQDGYMAATGYILAQCLTGQLPACDLIRAAWRCIARGKASEMDAVTMHLLCSRWG